MISQTLKKLNGNDNRGDKDMCAYEVGSKFHECIGMRFHVHESKLINQLRPIKSMDNNNFD